MIKWAQWLNELIALRNINVQICKNLRQEFLLSAVDIGFNCGEEVVFILFPRRICSRKRLAAFLIMASAIDVTEASLRA